MKRTSTMSGILWIIMVGCVAGIIARLLSPGPNNPSVFILTTILGIVGAFLATLIGQAIGHYGPDQGAGFIMATIGALVVLFIWNRLVASGVMKDFNRWSLVVIASAAKQSSLSPRKQSGLLRRYAPRNDEVRAS